MIKKLLLKNNYLFLVFLIVFSSPFCSAYAAANLSYTYDSLSRLTRVDYGNGDTIEYTYDAAGNRLTEKVTVPPPPAISVSLFPLDFGSIAQGGTTPMSRNVTVGNTGGKPLSWSAATDNAWLSITPSSGTVPAGGAGTPVAVSIDPAGLSIGSYSWSITITDNNASNSPLVVPVLFRISHYADPSPTPYSVTVSGTARKSGAPLAEGDEVAAFSVHPKPGVPSKFERMLVGHAVVASDNSFPGITVYGDDPLTGSATEGCVPGEEIQLALWSASDRKLYLAYVDNATGLPPVLPWNDNASSLTLDLDFVPGNRYPLRNGAWNLFSHGVLTGYSKGSPPTKPQLAGVAWENVGSLPSSMANAFPFKSLGSKLDRVVGNDGSGNKVYLAGVGGTMTWFGPGYGYWVKMKPSPDNQVLSWMTVPGTLSAGTETLTLGADNTAWTLGGYWGNEVTYNLSGYDASGELLPVSASDNVVVNPMGQVWASITGSYDRVVTSDVTGNHLYLPGLPSQIKYLGPGYGYWIKMKNPADLAYPAGTR